MRIQPVNYYNYSINKKRGPEVKTQAPKVPAYSTNSLGAPAFTGLFDWFSSSEPKEVSLNEDITALSRSQIRRRKENTSKEIVDLAFHQPYSEARSKRLDDLLQSPFVDYELRCIGDHLNELRDCVVMLYPPLNNKLYNQFLATSLAETMPFPEEKDAYETNWLKLIYYSGKGNPALKPLVHSYVNLDENSKEAQDIRKMLERLIDFGTEISDSKNLVAKSIIYEKPQLFQVLMKNFEIHASDKIELLDGKTPKDEIDDSDSRYYDVFHNYGRTSGVKTHSLYELSQLSDNEEIKNLFDANKTIKLHTIKKNKLLMNDLREVFSYPENRTPDKILELIKTFRKITNNDNGLEFNFLIWTMRNAIAGKIVNGEGREFMDATFNAMKYIKDCNIETPNDYEDYKIMYYNIGPKVGYNESYLISKEKEMLNLEEPAPPITKKINRENSEIATISEKYDVYNIENWTDIAKDLQKMQYRNRENGDAAIKFILNTLPDIFYTEENKETYKKIISLIGNIEGNWDVEDEFGNNLANRAVNAENPLLIQLAKDKNINFTKKNIAQKSALDSMEELKISPEISSSQQSLKVNSPELIKFAQNGLSAGVETLLENPYVDVNSVDSNKDSAGMVAAANGRLEVIRALNRNAEFDVNYTNPKTGENALTLAKDAGTLQALLESTKLEPDNFDENTPPIIFKLFSGSNPQIKTLKAKFKILVNSPKVQLDVLYKGQTLADKIKTFINNLDISQASKNETYKEFASILEDSVKGKNFDKTKEIVDKNGILTLTQIQNYVNFPNSEIFVNEPLNEQNETIGFFLTDIAANHTNISDIMQVLDRLVEKKYNFSKQNSFNQTILEKAYDADNKFIAQYIENLGK